MKVVKLFVEALVLDVNSKQDKRRRYSMMRSVESASSVFYHSQEEDPVKTSGDSQGSYKEAGPLYDSYQDSVTDSSPATTEQDAMGKKYSIHMWKDFL